MDSVHDMGGMHGFGRVEVTDVAPFQAEWERSALGVRLAMTLAGSRGELRPHIEAIPAAVYLASRYYERWARGLESLTVAAGILAKSEIDSRAQAHRSGALEAPVRRLPPRALHDDLAARLRGARNQAADIPGRFEVGDRVRVKRMSPAGHTRCPRYIRGVTGTVDRVTGGFARPDPGDHPTEQTYTIEFEMRDIWGDDAEPGVLCLDMWEGYLE